VLREEVAGRLGVRRTWALIEASEGIESLFPGEVRAGNGSTGTSLWPRVVSELVHFVPQEVVHVAVEGLVTYLTQLSQRLLWGPRPGTSDLSGGG
jgi:hypothetical protein